MSTPLIHSLRRSAPVLDRSVQMVKVDDGTPAVAVRDVGERAPTRSAGGQGRATTTLSDAWCADETKEAERVFGRLDSEVALSLPQTKAKKVVSTRTRKRPAASSALQPAPELPYGARGRAAAEAKGARLRKYAEAAENNRQFAARLRAEYQAIQAMFDDFKKQTPFPEVRSSTAASPASALPVSAPASLPAPTPAPTPALATASASPSITPRNSSSSRIPRLVSTAPRVVSPSSSRVSLSLSRIPRRSPEPRTPKHYPSTVAHTAPRLPLVNFSLPPRPMDCRLPVPQMKPIRLPIF